LRTGELRTKGGSYLADLSRTNTPHRGPARAARSAGQHLLIANSGADFRNSCADVGFKRFEVIHLDGAHGRFYDNDDSPSEKRSQGRPTMRQIEVYAVIPPRLLLLDVAGPLEVVRWANHVQTAVRFEVHYVGPSSSLQTSIGLTLTKIGPLPEKLPMGAFVVLAGDVEQVMKPGGQAQIEASQADAADEASIVEWLRNVIQPGHKLISICTGALLAARAGLLDGRACTTHYSCCTELALLAPTARVLENRLYVEDGECYSSAGITAGIDLMLYIVSQLTDQSCAVAIARYLLVYLRRSGADPQLSPWLEGRNHIHPVVHRVQDAIASDLTKSWTLSRLAKIAGAGDRHLSRLFNQNAGMSIKDYSNRLRVALAKELLSQTSLDMECVAERVGFASSRQLRRAWRKIYTTAPRQARSRSNS
jgi:transcriptional regulator GlxA family with amidase domain